MASEAGEKARLSRVAAVACIIAVAALAAALRFYRLYHHSFWNDEITTSYVIRYPASVILSFFARADSSPPLYLLVYRFWALVTHSFASRVFPAALGVLCVLVAMAVAGRLWGFGAAILAGLWLAVNPVSIYVSQEMRYPTLLALLFLLILWAAVRLSDEPSWLRALPLAVFTSAAIYTHYYAFIFVGLLGLFFVAAFINAIRKSAKELPRLSVPLEAAFFARDLKVRGFAAGAVVGAVSAKKHRIVVAAFGAGAVLAALLSFVPFLRTFSYQLLRGVPLREPIGVLELVERAFVSVNLSHSPNDLPVLSGVLEGLYGDPTAHLAVLFAISLFLLLPAFYALAVGGRARGLLALLGFGAIAALVVLTRRFPAFEPKYFSPFVPVFGLLWAYGASKLARPLQAAFAALCVAGGLLSVGDYYFDPRYQRQDWRGAARELLDSFGENEALVFYHLYESQFLTFYMGLAVPKVFLIAPKEGSYMGGTLVERERSIVEKAGELERYDGLWLLVYHSYVFDPNGVAERELKRRGFYEISRKCRMKGIRRFCLAHLVKGLERAADHFSSELDFSSDNLLLSQIVEGIDEPKDGWAWMAKEGKVYLKKADGRICVKFFVNCDFISCPVDITLYAGDDRIAGMTVERSDIYELCGAYSATENPVPVRVVSSKTFDPSRLYGGESRELSILLARIGWSKAGDRKEGL